MDFSRKPTVVFKCAAPGSMTSMRMERVNPGRITFNRRKHRSLVAAGSLPIKAVTQILSNKLSELSGVISCVNELSKFGFLLSLASLVLSIVTPWIITVTLRYKNLGLPSVGEVPIDRSQTAKKLLEQIKGGSNRFYFLYGSHATGKSTLVRSALAHRQRGSVYVLIEDGIEISLERLAIKIFIAMSWFLLVNLNVPAWIRLEKRFEELFKVNGLLDTLARRYKSMFKENLILVLDGANSLPESTMMHLLGMAKNLADTSPLIIVLVGTAGQLPHVCMKTSALSRGTFVVVPPIPDKDLKEYARTKLKETPSETIDRILNLVGGKVSNMDWCIELLKAGASIERVEAMYEKTFTYNSFALSGLFDLENKDWVRKLYEEMKEAGGELDVVVFQFIVPRKEIWRLNAGSVFSIDEQKIVRYESKANEQYAMQWLSRFDAWLKKGASTEEKGSKKNRRGTLKQGKTESAPTESPEIE